MDLVSLASFGGALSSQLVTALTSGSLHEKLLVSVPGYAWVHYILLKKLRVDVTKVLKWIIASYGVWMGSKSVWSKIVYPLLLRFCCVKVSIPANDRLNREVMSWMSSQVTAKGSRFISA